MRRVGFKRTFRPGLGRTAMSSGPGGELAACPLGEDFEQNSPAEARDAKKFYGEAFRCTGEYGRIRQLGNAETKRAGQLAQMKEFAIPPLHPGRDRIPPGGDLMHGRPS